MTIFVYALNGKVPPALSRLSCIKANRKLVKGVELVTTEDEWGSTDFYCTTTGLTVDLERASIRLQAQLVFLPNYETDFINTLTARKMRREHSRVRVAVKSDWDTMLMLQPPASLPLFDSAS